MGDSIAIVGAVYCALAGVFVVIAVATAVLGEVPLRLVHSRSRVAIGLTIALTPCAADVSYAVPVTATFIGATCALELVRLHGRVPNALIVLCLAVWVAIPLQFCWATSLQRTNRDVIVLVLLSDAYQFAGGAILGFGRLTSKPFPTLSPQKSLGGYIFSLLVSTLVGYTMFPEWQPLNILSVVLLGFVGDLAASLVKRRAGIKDFSSALAAHGGFMDRFDGALFATGVYNLACHTIT
jgi:CDP-diglyceride synthetase